MEHSLVLADVGLKSFSKLLLCVDNSYRVIRVPVCCDELVNLNRVLALFL
jgi:hypothetical protein